MLTGSTGNYVHQHPKDSTQVRSVYPQDRKDAYHKVSQDAPSPTFKRVVPGSRHGLAAPVTNATPAKVGHRDNPAMSFVMLTESQVVPPLPVKSVNGKPSGPISSQPATTKNGPDGDQKQSLSHQVEVTTRLFEILSSRSDIDHPICVECTEMLVEGLQKRLASSTRERDAYVDFLKKLNAEVRSPEELRKAEEQLKMTREAEAAAFAELVKLEQDKAAVDDEIASLEEEARQLDLEEEKFWRERNAFALTLSEFQNERDGVNLQYDHDSRQLERLQRTNVYNDTFCIGHDGFFGTINGLRLGRLANLPVEWAEINAAWGQTLLLLATVAEKLGFTFDGYRLKPMGSTSRIERIEYPQQQPPAPSSSSATGATTTTTSTPIPSAPPRISTLELYSSGELPLGLDKFMHRRFDSAMVAFLDCLRQLGQFVEHESSVPAAARAGSRAIANINPNTDSSRGKGLTLPYAIKKDKIGDTSIKLGFNQDENWTRACKYTLTCCKFLLAHASNVSGGLGRRAGA